MSGNENRWPRMIGEDLFRIFPSSIFPQNNIYAYQTCVLELAFFECIVSSRTEAMSQISAS